MLGTRLLPWYYPQGFPSHRSSAGKKQPCSEKRRSPSTALAEPIARSRVELKKNPGILGLILVGRLVAVVVIIVTFVIFWG